jgi:hypothetical protein
MGKRERDRIIGLVRKDFTNMQTHGDQDNRKESDDQGNQAKLDYPFFAEGDSHSIPWKA